MIAIVWTSNSVGTAAAQERGRAWDVWATAQELLLELETSEDWQA